MHPAMYANQLPISPEVVEQLVTKHAIDRLVETAKVIRDSMSVVEQPSLHARLRSDIEALNGLGFGGEL